MTYLQRIEALLDMPSGRKAEVLRELESHVDDIRDELVAAGRDPSGTDQEAERRMGSPDDIAPRLNAEYNVAGWKSTMLVVAPFFASVISVLFVAFAHPHIRIAPTILLALITVIASVRELILGRRPVWLATWLAAAMSWSFVLIGHLLPATAKNPKFTVSILFSIVLTLVFGVAAVSASFVVRKWQWAAIVPFAACCVCATAIFRIGPVSVSWVPIVVVILSMPYFSILLARAVFEIHPYGNGTQAALFILTVFVLGYSFSAPLHYWQTITALLVGAMLILVVRGQTRQLKERALSYAVLILATLSQVSSQNWTKLPEPALTLAFVLVAIAIYYSLFRFLVFIPIWMENRRRTEIEPPLIAL
jgi:hypothetical protein